MTRDDVEVLRAPSAISPLVTGTSGGKVGSAEAFLSNLVCVFIVMTRRKRRGGLTEKREGKQREEKGGGDEGIDF